MVIFRNKGLIDLRGITTFGVCVKPETNNPIGYFGTGLKYALAVLLREGTKVTMYHGTRKYAITRKIRKIRGQDFYMVQINGQDLPYTTELGKNWELWMAYRELAANAMDEPECEITDTIDGPLYASGYTTFVVEGAPMDTIHAAKDEIFLSTKPTYTFDTVELHGGPEVGGWLYYRGIRVYKLSKPAMYNYNLLTEVKLTEDRTLSSMYVAYRDIARAIVECDDASLIRQMLEANRNYFESTIDYSYGYSVPGETFNKIALGYSHTRTSYNTSARDLYKQHTPVNPLPVIVQWETIPINTRRKLWAALRFWEKLGIEIPRDTILVTEDIGGTTKGVVRSGTIYLNLNVLERDMRHVAGVIYSLYAEGKREGTELDAISLLVDTIVDFGEQLLGLKTGITRKRAA